MRGIRPVCHVIDGYEVGIPHTLDYDVVGIPDISVIIGVVGIVASNLLEYYRRPAVILVDEGDQTRGSARSVEGFDIAEALQSCSDLLVKHGGHAAAAGLTIRRENMDAFRQRINDLAREMIGPEAKYPRLRADAEVDLTEIDEQLLEQLLSLQPCGQDNPQPLFVSRQVEVASCRRVEFCIRPRGLTDYDGNFLETGRSRVV